MIFLVVVEKASNKVIGFEVVAKLTYEKSQKELFYWFFKEYWNEGDTGKATEAMCNFIFNNIEFEVDMVTFELVKCFS